MEFISGKNKNNQKNTQAKRKEKMPAYKLQTYIETKTNLKVILEERIFDAKIEFSLREALGIAKVHPLGVHPSIPNVYIS